MSSQARTTAVTDAGQGDSPARAGLVLAALILVAAVANLNLSVANVALPDIGRAFNSSQTTLDLIAVGCSLGLAASVLWFGALVAPRSATLVHRRGSRATLLVGQSALGLACHLPRAACEPEQKLRRQRLSAWLGHPGAIEGRREGRPGEVING